MSGWRCVLLTPLAAHAQDVTARDGGAVRAADARDVATDDGAVRAAETFGAAPAIVRARARYDEAAFEAVLEELSCAEASSALDRAAVLELLLLRALTHHAMGSRDAMRMDLERLAYLEPDLVPPSELPPSMRRELEDARAAVEPLRLLGDVERIAAGVRFFARPSGDPRGLVRRMEVECRSNGGGGAETAAS